MYGRLHFLLSLRLQLVQLLDVHASLVFSYMSRIQYSWRSRTREGEISVMLRCEMRKVDSADVQRRNIHRKDDPCMQWLQDVHLPFRIFKLSNFRCFLFKIIVLHFASVKAVF